MKENLQLNLKKYLRTTFEARCQRNARYSLRSFARDLGVSASNISRVMNGKRGFSNKTLEKISNRLALNESESELMLLLSKKQFGKSKKSKDEASLKLKKALIYQVKMTDDKFAVIADWYHLALLALMDRPDYQSNIKWMAQQLSLHDKIVEQALERLIDAGAVKKSKEGWTSTGNLFIDPKNIPSSAAKTFHQQVLKKADEALYNQGLEDRDFASIIMCFDKAKMKLAKQKIKKFREDFEAEFGPSENVQQPEVYAFGMQLFQLTKIKDNLEEK